MQTLLVGVAALLGAAVARAQAQPEETVRVRSLVPLMVPWQQLAGARHTALPGEQPDMTSRLDATGSMEAPSWVLELLAERHRAEVEGNMLTIATSMGEGEKPRGVGTCVLLRGRTAAVEACCRDLDALIALVGRPIEVTAWRLPLGDGALPATTWDASALQQALQRTPPVWTARGRTRSGGALRLAQQRGIGFLRDLDVEVAEGAQITDPKVDIALTGVRATLVVHALPGDRLLLDGSWLLSEQTAMVEQVVGREQASIDLPDHRTAWVSFAGCVASGGALVVAGRGDPVGPSPFALVVGARYLSPPGGDLGSDVLVRPVGALLSGVPVAEPVLSWPGPGDELLAFANGELAPGLTGADLLGLLQTPTGTTLNGGMLVVQGDADACRRADVALQQLFASLRTVTLHSRVGCDAGGTLELVQPLLADREAGAFVGRERSMLRDHEVEISTKAQAANPIVGIAYSGLWLHGIVARAGSGWHVAGSWSVAMHDEPRVREHADKPPMTIQLVDYRHTTLPWDALMAPDQEHVLGDGPSWKRNGPATSISVRLLVQ